MRHRKRPSPMLEATLVALLTLGVGGLIRGCGSGSHSEFSPVGAPASERGSLQGRVYAEEGGAALAGATVEVLSAGVALSTVTDLSGNYVFEEVPAGSHRLQAQAPGFFLRRASVFVGVRSAEGRDLALERIVTSGALDTVVRIAPEGAPLAGVRAVVLETGQTAFSSPVGRLFLAGLPAGTVRLQLSLRGFATRVVTVSVPAGGIAAPSLRLTDARSILGGVVRSEPPLAPLTHALVSLPGLAIETVTDPTGAYQLLDVPANVPYDVMFSEPSHESLLVTTSHGVGGVTILNVTLQRGFGEVVGTVRQILGPNLPGAVVSIPLFGLTTTTDGAGQYRFPRVPAAQLVSIGARAANHLQEGTPITVPRGGIAVQDFDLIPRTGSVTGTVSATSSAAGIPGVVVELPNLFTSTATDASGTYLFTDLPVGLHLATFTAAGFSPLTTFLPVDPGITRVADQELEDL